jgi:FkbM family methyltransferase
MFKIYFIRKIINFIDSFQQKKIFNILKKKLKPKAILFDVGAHHGETIRNFKNNFDFKQIHSFEVSKQNFMELSKNYKNFNDEKIIINNFGLSNKSKELQFNQFIESSSSTISKINVKSLYFKRKIKILGFLKNNRDYYETFKVQLNSLDNYMEEKNVDKIDLLKIDTEGHEYFVLKGGSRNLPKINYIYFEHHYDDMLDKGYKFSDIHEFLINNDFKKIFKSKMYFRKTFEYIYENSRFN